MIPGGLRRESVRLLDLQMWCWGLDIRCETGNALIRYGFERHAVREGVRGSNAYCRATPPGTWLVLWGSGLLYGVEGTGAVVLGRFDAAPRYRERADPEAHELTAGAAPAPPPAACAAAMEAVLRLVPDAFGEIAAYERWALAELGVEHRRRCLGSRKNPGIEADGLAAAWEALVGRWILPGIGQRRAS